VIMATITTEGDEHVEGFALLERAELTIELESSCQLDFRKRIWANMKMDDAVEFDAGDLGPSGGVQVRELVGRQMGQRAADDRISRYPGECDPGKPWPRIQTTTEKNTEERLDKLSAIGERIRRAIVDLQKKGMGGKGGGLPTLSEADSRGDDSSGVVVVYIG